MTELNNLDYNQIVFPKLGIDITINSDAFTIFGLTVKWYGIIIAFGIVLAMLYGFSQMKKFGLDADRAIDCIFAGMIGGIIGARLYFVIIEWENYKGDFKSIFNIRNGGLAIYGGIIGAVLAAALVAKWRKVKLLPLLDIAGMGFLIGQGIGRWGNFTNHEAFGYNTDSIFGMSSGKIQEQIYYMTASLNPTDTSKNAELVASLPVHPCFLYESVWCLLGFALFAWFSKRRKYDGQLFLMYAGWYGLGRFFIEGLRTDSLMVGNLRVSQVLAAICVITSAILLIVIGQKVKSMGEEYVLYCNTEESKQLLAEAEERMKKSKTNKSEDKTDIEDSEVSDEAEKNDDNNDSDDEDSDEFSEENNNDLNEDNINLEDKNNG
ncbi:MAG: prolipoprotein diacylglyceryl transferase [Clostridiales bacterium]|nr:prolipoprotein diacylglyceryl transferase [Clostridiales bacterium]